MKLQITFAVLLIFATLSNIAQNPSMQLTFLAHQNNEPVLLDSIYIKNLTQQCDTILYYPNNVLTLNYLTKLHEISAIKTQSFSIVDNYPNPFYRSTKFTLRVSVSGQITLKVFDHHGTTVAEKSRLFSPGNHTFEFLSSQSGVYFVTANNANTNQSIKIIEGGRNQNTRAKCQLFYTGLQSSKHGLKQYFSENEFVFTPGDEMEFSGYAQTVDGILGNDVIKDFPQSDSIYNFEIVKGIRCPGNASLTDIDGNIYRTTLIGTQCWMQENLKTTTYKNGTPIPNITDDSTWQYSTTGVYSIYNNNEYWLDIYGAFYNWHAVEDSNGLCPDGWHVPTDDEWLVLTNYIGGTGAPSANMLKTCRQIDSPLGNYCNTTEHPRWDFTLDNFGTDDFGFSALPAGSRYIDGTFDGFEQHAVWWTGTTYYTGKAWVRHIVLWSGNIQTNQFGKRYGLSVRCIKD